MTIKNYSLFLPVFKQGDDFGSCVESNNGHPIKSFECLSEQYKTASEICQRVASTLASSINLDDIEVGGDAHYIYVNAPEEIVASLLHDAILVEDDATEEDE